METLRYGKVKARKAHVCSFCGCTIPVGETYWRSAHKANGELYDWKSHEQCAELVDMLNMEGDEGVTGEDFYEYITDAFEWIWDDIDPGIDPDFEIPEFSKQVDFVYSHLKTKTMEEAEHKLWQFFKDEHDLILTAGQLDDIVQAVNVFNDAVNQPQGQNTNKND